MDELLSIGEVARASGLSVSALRFYDRSGVLVPSRVDPVTAYRWYSSGQAGDARLIAALRRVGLPIPEISTILAHRGDAGVLRRLLADHLGRLEAGLAAAKSEVARIESRWTSQVDSAAGAVRVVGTELARGLDVVSFAVGATSELVALHGVLMEAADGRLLLTATDRYRAAFFEMAADGAGIRVVLDGSCLQDLADRVRDEPGLVSLRLNGDRLNVDSGGGMSDYPVWDVDFPDLSAVATPPVVVSAEVDRARVQQILTEDAAASRWLVGVSEQGSLSLSTDVTSAGEADLLLDAEFLAQAVDATDTAQLRFEICGPIAPLAIRSVDDPAMYSVIMPIRRDR